MTIVLVVKPSRDARRGTFAYNTRGQLWDGVTEGRTVVSRSTTPFTQAARRLIEEGIDPGSRYVMRHAGRDDDALISTVGAAARLTVADDGTGKPRFAPWVDLKESFAR